MLAHIPTWVFLVFALLVALGVWQSRPRVVSPIAPVVLAVAFPLYSLYGVVSSFGAAVSTLLPWIAGLALSILAGQRVFGPRDLARIPGSTRVRIPGSWMPFALMMGIFLAKFAVGFVQGARLPVGQQAWFAPAICLFLGALSGGFASRAVTVRSFLRAATSGA